VEEGWYQNHEDFVFEANRFLPGTAQLRKPVSGLNKQANKSLHAGSDSELGGENFQGEIQ